MAVERPLSVWAVSDGRAGVENQALGLAEAVARLTPATVEVRRVAYRVGTGRLPTALLATAPFALLKTPLEPPWPDLWIAAGRATLPLSERVRTESAGRTFVVQVQAPRRPLDRFGLVVAPEHDRVRGRGVVEIVGSPNRVTPERLAEGRAAFADRIDTLPSPRIAVLVGGKSKAYELSAERAAQIGEEVAVAVRASRGSLLATFSRRTSDDARRVLEAAWADVPGWLWDGTGDNPYFAFLDAAEVVLVTEDSANMATEAGTAGRPVLTLRAEGYAPKFERFHESLRRLGVARRFEGDLTPWSYAPLRETERAAAAVLDAYRRQT